MAIVNLGAKRLQGLKLDRVNDSLGADADGTNSGVTLNNSATGGTDLTSSSQSWTQVGTEIVKTNDTITATNASDDDSNGSTGSDRVHTALPSTLSNTKHTTDFDLRITANASSGDPDIVPIMYTAGTSAFGAGSQDGYGFDMYSDTGNGNNYVVRLIARDGTDNDYSSGIVLTPTTQYYCRLVRNSATLGTLNVYTDSARTTHTSGSPQTLTIASGSDRGKDCTHLQSSTWSGSGQTSYVVENVKLYNDKVVGNVKLGTGAYSLSGTNPVHFPNANDNKLLPATGDFSITCWIYHTGHSDHQQIFRCQDSNGSSEGEFRINSSGTSSQEDRLALNLPIGSNGTVMTTNAVPQNEWVHLAVTRTGATVKLYINGVLETNQNTSGTFNATSAWGNDTPRIGRMENANETIQGKIDDMGVWHRVLTATEVGKLANNNSPAWSASQGQSTVSGNTGSGSITFADNKCRIQSATYTDVYAYGLDMGVDITGDYCLDFEFTMNSNTYVSSGQACGWILGLSVANSAPTGENPSHANYEQTKFNSYTSGNPYVYVRSKNASGTNDVYSQEPVFTLNSSTAQTRYGRLIRDGTTLKVSVFSDSGRTTQLGSDVSTTTNASQNVRYLYIKQFTQNSSNTWDFDLDNIKLYNGQTTATGSVTKTVDFNAGDAQLVSSLTNKSELKANYTMDSTALASLKNTADWTEDFSETTPTAWTEDSSSGYANNLEPYKGSVNRLWFDLDENTSVGVMGMLDSQNAALLGANPSNTLWTFRFKINFTSLSSAGGSMWIGFTDSNTAASNGACRFAGCRIKTTVGIQNGSDNGGQALTSSNRTTGGVATTVTTGTDYYVTVSRHTANKLVTTVRSGSHTGAVTGEVTADDLETATDDLRYWKIMNNRSSTNGGQLQGYLYDLEFFNDSATTTGCKNDHSSTADLTLYDTPTNTIFEQTDDTPSYWFKQSDNTWKMSVGYPTRRETFTSDDWTDSDSSCATVQTNNTRLWFNANNGGDNQDDSTVYDLGAGNVSDTQWTLRWEYVRLGGGGSGNGHNHTFGLAKNDQTYHSGDSTDSIMMGWGEPQNSGQSYMGIQALNNSTGNSNGHFPTSGSRVQGIDLTQDKTYYMELKRESASKATFTIWSDEFGGTALSGFPVSNTVEVSSSLADLRYIKWQNRGHDGTRSGTLEGSIKNVDFWNGVVL